MIKDEKLVYDLNTILREQDICTAQIKNASKLLSKLELEFNDLEKRLTLLNDLTERTNNYYAEENKKLVVKERSSVLSQLLAQKDNIKGYEELLKVLVEIEKEFRSK